MNKRFILRILMIGLVLSALLLSALPVAAAPVHQGGIHVVQPGENLSSIAVYYGVSTAALAQANGITNPNWIYVGQRLTIPGAGGSSSDGSSSDSSSSSVHVVSAGQNLSSIAAYYGLNLWTLASINGISNPNQIYAGQRLLLSGNAAAAPAAAARPAVQTASSGRWIDVDLSNQLLTAYEGSTPMFSTLISSGLMFPTPTGTYSVLYHVAAQRMTGPGYDLPNVPWVMYFTNRGHAIHGAYWHNNFGQPMSHGCINMRVDEAQWLYNFTPNGAPVVVHY